MHTGTLTHRHTEEHTSASSRAKYRHKGMQKQKKRMAHQVLHPPLPLPWRRAWCTSQSQRHCFPLAPTKTPMILHLRTAVSRSMQKKTQHIIVYHHNTHTHTKPNKTSKHTHTHSSQRMHPPQHPEGDTALQTFHLTPTDNLAAFSGGNTLQNTHTQSPHSQTRYPVTTAAYIHTHREKERERASE